MLGTSEDPGRGLSDARAPRDRRRRSRSHRTAAAERDQQRLLAKREQGDEGHAAGAVAAITASGRAAARAVAAQATASRMAN